MTLAQALRKLADALRMRDYWKRRCQTAEARISLPGRKVWGPKVERWRSLIYTVFTERCQAAQRRAPTEYEIDMAMAIIQYESGGDHLVRSRLEWIGTPPPGYDGTPSTRATGLCQHVPAYWVGRSRAAGYEDWPILDPVAQVGVMAWLVYEGWHPETAPHWHHWQGGHVGIKGSMEKAIDTLAALYPEL